MKWLGVETEVFNSTPHIKQQDAAIGVPGFSGTVNLAGTFLRVLNWAPVNVVVRYQMGQFEPYAGVGMGVFFANVTEAVNGESSSGTTVCLNTQLGLRYLVTKNMSCLANGNIAVPALTSRHQAPRKQPEELKETTAPTFWPSASATTANRS
jgi:opacity protein-like surface antigen